MNWNEFFSFLEPLNTPWLTTIFKVIIIAVLGSLLIRIINTAVKKVLEKSKLEKAAHGLIRTLVKTMLYILLGLILASSIGIDVTGIVALASVATLAVSLALQNMLTNIIGGFTLLYTDPFSAGDFIEVDGQSGTVKDVGMAYTCLITADNKTVYIPNSTMLTADIVNYSVGGNRRMDIPVSASYDADPEFVIAALLEAAQDDRILPDKAPTATLTGYGDHAISYVVRIWAKNEDYWDIHQKVTRQIYVTFKEKGIEMTYPHLNVHLDK
ncbi:MAG: mechanosensitive ion channel family protein [Ruminococcaceae bacterium]|nr:mechanosensitive ion channel family protein [Oscillospiraceae bacterium]